MAEYRLRIFDWDEEIDTQVVDLPDLATARKFAAQMAADWLTRAPSRFWLGGEIRLDLRDPTGIVLLNLIIVAGEPPEFLSRPAH